MVDSSLYMLGVTLLLRFVFSRLSEDLLLLALLLAFGVMLLLKPAKPHLTKQSFVTILLPIML